MRTIIKLAAAAAPTLTSAAGAFAQEFTNGAVKKADAKTKKVTLIHEELKSLEMPAMAMVFTVEDEALLAKLKEGAKVQFVAERKNGN